MRIGKGIGKFRKAAILLTAFSLVSLASAAPAGQSGTSVRQAGTRGIELAKAASSYGKLPLSFEENKGQTDASVRYLSRGSGYTLFLTEKDAVLSLATVDKNRQKNSTAIRMGFAGSTGAATVEASELQPGRSSYLSGRDSSKWLTNISQFGRVNYRNVYPGIDASFYGNQRQLEYDLIVAPGADPKQIRLRYEGIGKITVAKNGNLMIETALGNLEQLAPVSYQTINGVRRPVASKYAVRSNGEVTFDVARYDRSQPLVIDPVVQWSTFIGGTSADVANSIALDSANNIYLTGYTTSADFPEATVRFGGTRGISGTQDAFIVKIAAGGSTLLKSSYLAGENDDQGMVIKVDNEGSVYVAGFTNSNFFPTATPFQDTLSSNTVDAFIVKLPPALDSLTFGTYLGGIGDDRVNDMAIDSGKNIVLVGTTTSSNFSGTTTQVGGADAFVAKLNADGRTYAFRVYLGSRGTDSGNGVALDSANNIYVTGRTNRFDFPTTAGVIQPNIVTDGAVDAFVTKYNPTGTRLYSTFMGGAGYDEGIAIGVDNTGAAYIFGVTESANFPTLNPIRGALSGTRDAFLTKLNPTATARVYSTFLGGSGSDNAEALFLNPATGGIVLTGWTNSADLPVASANQAAIGGGADAFVMEINPAGTGYVSSSYLGGAGDDFGNGVTQDGAGNIYVTGTTFSFNFPITAGARQLSLSGTQDAFVTKLSNCTVGIAPAGRAHGAATEMGTIAITGAADCSWVARVDVPWITITTATSGTGNVVLGYLVAANTNAPRTGLITVGNQTFTVTQAGAPIAGGGCVYDIPTTDILAASGAGRSFLLGTSTTNCPFTVFSNVPWIQVFPPNGTNTTTVTYTVYPNFNSQARNGTITVVDHTPGVAPKYLVVSQAAPFLAEMQRFVTLAYFNFLGRYPTQGEIDFQTGALINGLPRADLIMNFFNAEEFNQGGRFVAGLYVGLLGRDAEFAGWLFQRNALVSGGVSQASLVNNFLNSGEFGLLGPLTNDQFVVLMYQRILGRNPVQAEQTFQVNALNTNLVTRVGLATSFLNSAEFRIGTSSRLTAFLLHAALLGRSPSQNELINRSLQLSTGTSLRALVADFIASQEFTTQTQ